MDLKTFEYVQERVEILAKSDSSKQETKEAAQAWLDDIAADKGMSDIATDRLLGFLHGRPTSVDYIIAFASGPGQEVFGQEAADQMVAHAKARKIHGAKYCDCEACTAARELLEKFDRL